VALQRLADTEAALDSYRAALSADPAHPAAAVNLTEALFEQGLGEEAIARCRVATIARAADAGAWLDLAAALDRADQFFDAAQALEQAKRLDGTDWLAAHRLGEIRQRLGQFVAAIEEHEYACTLAPQRPEVWRQLGLAALRAGDCETALAGLDELLRLAPYDAEGWAYRALALRQAGRNDLADELTSRPDLVAVVPLAPPAGYGSLEAFHRVLGTELAAVGLRAWAPRGQSVVGGSQTQNDLFALPTPAIQAFRAHVDQAIAEFAANPGRWALHLSAADLSALQKLVGDAEGRRASCLAHPPGGRLERRLLCRDARGRTRPGRSGVRPPGLSGPLAERTADVGRSAARGKPGAVPLLPLARHAALRRRRRAHDHRLRPVALEP
jgi:Flp pilus assembly protein TadD